MRPLESLPFTHNLLQLAAFAKVENLYFLYPHGRRAISRLFEIYTSCHEVVGGKFEDEFWGHPCPVVT
jgi:hypothetical protein